MKIDEIGLAKAAGATGAVLWLICSLLVVGVPGAMMNMSGHMVHVDLTGRSWTMTGTGFLVGLVAWVVAWAFSGWLMGFFYNKFRAE